MPEYTDNIKAVFTLEPIKEITDNILPPDSGAPSWQTATYIVPLKVTVGNYAAERCIGDEIGFKESTNTEFTFYKNDG